MPYETLTIGHSVRGRPIEAHVVGDGTERILLVATIHGDEPAGTSLLDTLRFELLHQPKLLTDRCVVLVPVVNPDGYARGTRSNIHGVDLNRNFPAANFSASPSRGAEPLSEPEARAIKLLIDQYQPTRVVSIHQPVGCVDYDGPGRALAEVMAAEMNLPVRKLGGRAGSLGSFVGITNGVPIITLELPGGAHRLKASELWERYGAGLLTVIAYPEVVAAAR